MVSAPATKMIYTKLKEGEWGIPVSSPCPGRGKINLSNSTLTQNKNTYTHTRTHKYSHIHNKKGFRRSTYFTASLAMVTKINLKVM